MCSESDWAWFNMNCFSRNCFNSDSLMGWQAVSRNALPSIRAEDARWILCPAMTSIGTASICGTGCPGKGTSIRIASMGGTASPASYA